MMAGINLTKIAAAQRQIDAGIRVLLLHYEDLTAIHTVAAAARTIVKNLAIKRGIDPRADIKEAIRPVFQT